MESKHLAIIAAAVAGAAVAVAVSLNQGGVISPSGDTSSALPPDRARGMEKCYGIAKAGENDCSGNAGAHSCKGFSVEDFHGRDWKLVMSGTCLQLTGQLEAFSGINPKIQS